MSYIVKNCPAIISLYERPQCVLPSNYYCADCTDCIIKQVIEKCTNIISTTFSNECFELAKEVTNLFDIEEVRE